MTTDLIEKALELPQKEPARLAHALILSMETTDDDGVTEAWAEEIQRRVERVHKGLAKGRPAEDVFRDLGSRGE